MPRNKPYCTAFSTVTLLLGLIFSSPVTAEEMLTQPGDDRTLSPYFFVNAATEGVDLLPLQGTTVVVDITGVIADVKVTQVYKNTGTQALEAIYVFPASTRAAVYGMKMIIGERVQVARVEERQAAQATYEAAKQKGQSASLLEQQRPNVFQMRVANIMPADTIQVELAYTELLKSTDGVYDFVYPTVVGPRYSNQPAANAPAREHWIANPYLTEGTAAPYTFEMTTHLAAGLPIQEITSSSHEVEVAYSGPTQAIITLAPSETNGGNRDVILKYRLRGGKVETGLLLYEGEGENFFLLMMQPPRRVATAQIPDREYVFVVDVSGSMHGFPLTITKTLLKTLLSHLRPEDRFNIVLFAGTSALLAERSLVATPANIQRALRLIDKQRGGGGTELLPALRRALLLPQAENVSRTLVIVTDGYVNIEIEAFELVRNNLHRANVFAFGIGSSVNRFLIEGLARAGSGEPFIVTDPAAAAAQAEAFRTYIQTPVLTDIRLGHGTFEMYDIEPPSIPDMFAERPVVLFGKWRGKPQGILVLHGVQGDQAYNQTLAVEHVSPQPHHAALRYLWARHRITTLGDYNRLQAQDARIAQITQLGLQYNLLTAYTSFVAVDEQVRRVSGPVKAVRQPLPLPKGVSNHAVGGNVPSVPEPETFMLLGVLGLLLGVTAYRKRQELQGLWDRYRTLRSDL